MQIWVWRDARGFLIQYYYYQVQIFLLRRAYSHWPTIITLHPNHYHNSLPTFQQHKTLQQHLYSCHQHTPITNTRILHALPFVRLYAKSRQNVFGMQGTVEVELWVRMGEVVVEVGGCWLGQFIWRQNLRQQIKQISLSFCTNRMSQLKNIILKMQEQSELKNQIKTWHQVEGEPILVKNTFLALHYDYKFRMTERMDAKRKTYIIKGHLVYNNGATVYISPTYHPLATAVLNLKTMKPRQRIVYSIDPDAQTLTFLFKIGRVSTQNKAGEYKTQLQKEILQNKKNILAFLCVLGESMASEKNVMQRLLFEKRKVKKELEDILSKTTKIRQNRPAVQPISINNYMVAQEQIQKGVIYYGSNTRNVLKSQQASISEEQGAFSAVGGYFKIEESVCMVVDLEGRALSGELVLKSLKGGRKGESNTRGSLNTIKLQRQIEIVNMIEDKRFLINYYVQNRQQKSIDQIYMDRYKYSLHEYLYETHYCLDIQRNIAIAKQVVHSVSLLHDSQVIHRDVKPANFLLADSIADQDIRIKIIDFAESFSAKLRAISGVFGCSHPYSPFECTNKRKIINGEGQEGLSKLQIDYWSVGVTIYELFFKRLPLSYSKVYLFDVVSGWQKELVSLMDQREKIGLNLVQSIIQILCLKMMRIKQGQRLPLSKALQMLNMLQSYVQRLFKMLQHIS